MTQIDFYILPDTTLEARLEFACRLAETIHAKGFRLHVHVEDEAMARQFDEHLWQFRPESFVPHALDIDLDTAAREAEHADDIPRPPVTIGWQEAPAPGIEALLNLHPEIPEWFSRFDRVAEIINQHQDVLVTKRECWRTYKSRGYAVRSHQLKGVS